MPTYVYRFLDTGETIEIRQGFDDAALTEAPHPSDGKPRPVKKVFTPVGITFKGSGFYKTDSGSSKKPASSTTTSPSGDSGSTTTSTPASTTDSATSSGASSGTSSTSTTSSTAAPSA